MTMRSTNIDILRRRTGRRSGFTLVEMLISVTLTLVLMYAVAEIFSVVAGSVNDSRSLLGLSDRLRATRARLELDLDGLTAPMLPPLNPADSLGYFELIEGPVGPVVTVSERAISLDDPSNPVEDTTVIDYDDILMFTTRTTTNEPFIGRSGFSTKQSRFAEVAWFVRGRTLYRRVKLIRPLTETFPLPSSPYFSHNAFEELFDFSIRLDGDSADSSTWRWICNTLGDLTKRENRMYHNNIDFPFLAQPTQDWQVLGLPTLGETSDLDWMQYQLAHFGTAGGFELPTVMLNPSNPALNLGQLDFWNEPSPYTELNQVTGNLEAYKGPRVGEDVILTNVIGFDVKVWDPDAPVISDGTNVLKPGDPGYPRNYTIDPTDPTELEDAETATKYDIVDRGAFVDLGHNYRPYVASGGSTPITSVLSGPCAAKSSFPIPSVTNLTDLPATTPPFIYDTWSTHYEYDGVDNDGDGNIDTANDGLDNGGTANVVDDVYERETSPPYPVPLRAIQIKIRVFEPDSRQVRQITIRHYFPKK